MIDKKTLIKINAIDVNYRDIEDSDLQFDVMKYILNCLSDKQLDTTKKLIEVTKVFEKNKKMEEK
jgi:hypothetical protein